MPRHVARVRWHNEGPGREPGTGRPGRAMAAGLHRPNAGASPADRSAQEGPMQQFSLYRAGDVMTHRPVTIGPHAMLADAERLFEVYGFNCLPVHGGEALLGVLTQLDLLRAVL